LFLEAFGVLYADMIEQLRARGRRPTQSAVAAAFGLRPSSVSEWLRQEHRGISLAIVNRICDRARVTPAAIFSGKDVLSDRWNASKSVAAPGPSADATRGGRSSAGRDRRKLAAASSSSKGRRLTQAEFEEIKIALENLEIATNYLIRRILRPLVTSRYTARTVAGEDHESPKLHRRSA